MRRYSGNSTRAAEPARRRAARRRTGAPRVRRSRLPNRACSRRGRGQTRVGPTMVLAQQRARAAIAYRLTAIATAETDRHSAVAPGLLPAVGACATRPCVPGAGGLPIRLRVRTVEAAGHALRQPIRSVTGPSYPRRPCPAATDACSNRSGACCTSGCRSWARNCCR
jgi:hypothetical protein